MGIEPVQTRPMPASRDSAPVPEQARAGPSTAATIGNRAFAALVSGRTAPPSRNRGVRDLARGDSVPARGNRALARQLSRARLDREARAALEGAGIGPAGVVHPRVEAMIDARRGLGAPLAVGVREPLEGRFDDTLSDVRIHTDSAASALARSVAARAFTVGADIFFDSGEYRPGTTEGDGLIAHEVAHTIQQRGAPASGSLRVSEPGDTHEREADQAARVLPRRAVMSSTVSRTLQRDPRRTTATLPVPFSSDLHVGIEIPDPIVLSRYDGGWVPRAWYKQGIGLNIGFGAPAHFFLNGVEHDSWSPENEWVSLRPVPKSALQQPGADTFTPVNNSEAATFTSRPEFRFSEQTVAVADAAEVWRSHLRGRPVASSSEDAFDETNVIPVLEQAGGAASRPAQAITVNISQSVATTVSQVATGTFGHTTTRSRETSAEIGGEKGKGTPGDSWKVSGKLGVKFAEQEQEQAQRALADTYAEVATKAESYTVVYNVPAAVPCAVLIVPVTRKITTTFEVLDTDPLGFARGRRSDTAVSESHVPKGHAAVFGYDVDYADALQLHYEQCRALRVSAEGQPRERVEQIKSQLRAKITGFSTSHQPSAIRARANALSQLRAIAPAQGPTVVPPPAAADNIVRWHTALEDIWRYAADPATPPPGGGTPGGPGGRPPAPR